MTTVYVVDDSKLAGLVVDRILKPFKIEILHIQEPDDLFGNKGGRYLLHEVPPSAILLDIVMPKMNGLDVLRKLRARKDIKQVPILMLTASANERNVMEAAELGANGFLTKPIDSQRLCTELARICYEIGQRELTQALSGFLGDAKDTASVDEDLQLGIVDLNYLSQILGEDMDLMIQMVQVFLDDIDSQVDAVRVAIEKWDPEAARKTAHHLKGSVGNFGAPLIVGNAQRIEKAGEVKQQAVAVQLLGQLLGDVSQMKEELQAWLAKHNAV